MHPNKFVLFLMFGIFCLFFGCWQSPGIWASSSEIQAGGRLRKDVNSVVHFLMLIDHD